jgi:hypothetical protein
MQGSMAPSGIVKLKVIKRQRVPARELSLWEIMKYGLPHFGLSREVALWRFKNIPNLFRGFHRMIIARLFKLPRFNGQLSLTIIRGNGEVVDLGLASLRFVTDAGVAFLVDALRGAVEPELLNFHGFGTGTTAENQNQTALVTELTTQYVSDNTRPTGTQTDPTANVYRTVATLSPDSGGTLAITEHGVFSQAATGGGTMLDRSVFAAVNIVAGSDSLQAQYDFTITAGG